jgi:hypothetical protein
MTRSVDVFWPSGGAHAVPYGYMPWHVRDNALNVCDFAASPQSDVPRHVPTGNRWGCSVAV